MSKVTIKTLAEQLGLSIATVSKALKDSYEISADTKKRVLDLASELSYIPNPYASSLRKQKSGTIAIVLPEVADNFFSLAINGIQSIAIQRNYHALIYLSHDNAEMEKSILRQCSSGRVDGVLISVSNETTDAAHIEKLKEENIPVVFFDRDIENYVAPKVLTNDRQCGYMAASHLIERGCRHPVFLSISGSLSICNKRSAGFTAALTEAQLYSSDHHFSIDCSSHNGSDITLQIQDFLGRQPAVDGIVASGEKIAIHTYLACLNQKISIPGDIKIIAFSTLETAPILNPSLTTIAQPAFEIGSSAAEILFNLIDKRKNVVPADHTITLPSVLIERRSTSVSL